MWIEKRSVQGKTRYCFIERYKSSLTGRYRRVSVTYGKKTPQVVKTATRELEEKIQKALAEEGRAVRKITMQELETRFLDDYEKQVRYNTYHNGEIFLDEFVEACGPSTRPSAVTTVWLNRYFNKQLYRHDHPLTNGTVRSKKGKIALLFEYAVNYGFLKDNPMDKVKITWKNEASRRRDEIENKYLTLDEYHSIINDCIDRNMQYYADAFQLQFLTGMRFGELSGLQVNDIIKEDGNKVRLRIDGTMIWKKNPYRHFLSHDTKTFAGLRTITLSPTAANIVEQHAKGKSQSALLFAINQTATTYNQQKPLNVNNANQYLKRAVERQKIDKNVTTHYFRHTHVSVLADMDVPLRVIQKRVGHAKGDITTQIYMHVTKQAQDDFENQIGKIDKL